MAKVEPTRRNVVSLSARIFDSIGDSITCHCFVQNILSTVVYSQGWTG